jgi:hypothetical protein
MDRNKKRFPMNSRDVLRKCGWQDKENEENEEKTWRNMGRWYRKGIWPASRVDAPHDPIML